MDRRRVAIPLLSSASLPRAVLKPTDPADDERQGEKGVLPSPRIFDDVRETLQSFSDYLASCSCHKRTHYIARSAAFNPQPAQDLEVSVRLSENSFAGSGVRTLGHFLEKPRIELTRPHTFTKSLPPKLGCDLVRSVRTPQTRCSSR